MRLLQNDQKTFTLYLFGTCSIIEEAEDEDRGKVFLPAALLLSEMKVRDSYQDYLKQHRCTEIEMKIGWHLKWTYGAEVDWGRQIYASCILYISNKILNDNTTDSPQ